MKLESVLRNTGISATRYYFARLQEALWFRPLLSCLLSIAAALVAMLAEQIELSQSLPNISTATMIE